MIGIHRSVAWPTTSPVNAAVATPMIGERDTIDRDRASDRGAVASKHPLPVRHSSGRRPGRARRTVFVVGRTCARRVPRTTEDGEEVARNKAAVRVRHSCRLDPPALESFRVGPMRKGPRQVGSGRGGRDTSGYDAEGLGRTFGETAGPPWVTDGDQLLGMRDRQRPQHERVDQREDRGVGADARRSRSRGRSARSLADAAGCGVVRSDILAQLPTKAAHR